MKRLMSLMVAFLVTCFLLIGCCQVSERVMDGKAYFWLNKVREQAGQEDVSIYLEFMESARHREGLNLAALCTNTQELAELERRGNLNGAKFWLARAQAEASKGNVEQNLWFMGEELKKAGYRLEDIGTSEEEVKSLLVQGHISAAKWWLEQVREKAGQEKIWTYETDFIREHAEKAGVTLGAIGTSEEELKIILGKIPKPSKVLDPKNAI